MILFFYCIINVIIIIIIIIANLFEVPFNSKQLDTQICLSI